MTVKELIARLQNCNPESVVSCNSDNDIDSYSQNIFVTNPTEPMDYITIILYYERT